jgi:hypothetical protein
MANAEWKPITTRNVKMRARAPVSLMAVSGCAKQGPGPKTVGGMLPVATLEMHQVQAAYIASAGGGDGTVFYNGQSYPFRVGGSALEASVPPRGRQRATFTE